MVGSHVFPNAGRVVAFTLTVNLFTMVVIFALDIGGDPNVYYSMTFTNPICPPAAPAIC